MEFGAQIRNLIYGKSDNLLRAKLKDQWLSLDSSLLGMQVTSDA